MPVSFRRRVNSLRRGVVELADEGGKNLPVHAMFTRPFASREEVASVKERAWAEKPLGLDFLQLSPNPFAWSLSFL